MSKDIIEVKRVSIFDSFQIAKVYADEENLTVTAELLYKVEKAYESILSKGDFILGAYSGKTLVGCLTVHFLGDAYPGYTEGPYLHIETIILNQKYHNLGIGTRMISAALEEGKNNNATYAIAQTMDVNVGAKRMFEKAGMQHKYVNYYYEF